jgi:hypothetical protein
MTESQFEKDLMAFAEKYREFDFETVMSDLTPSWLTMKNDLIEKYGLPKAAISKGERGEMTFEEELNTLASYEDGKIYMSVSDLLEHFKDWHSPEDYHKLKDRYQRLIIKLFLRGKETGRNED